MSDDTTFAYVIACDCGDGRYKVKVGIASDPRARLRNLKTASPFPLQLVTFFALPNRFMAKEIEGAFHTVMAEHRLAGEWFDIAPHKAVLAMCSNIEAMIKVSAPEDVWDEALEISGVTAIRAKHQEHFFPRGDA